MSKKLDDQPQAFTDNTSRGGDAIKRGLDSPPAPDPETNGQDDKLEAQRDAAEELKLEARLDGVKDIELEALIEKLESAGDMVEETKEPVGKKAFARNDWGTSDRVNTTPARMEKGWYGKSPRAQRIELEKMMGTYRRHDGDPYVKTRANGGGEYRIMRNGPLRDAADRHRDAVADTILITAADKATPRPPAPPPPPPPPEPVKGYCRECHKALPRYGIRSDAKFCSEACSKAFRRREANRDTLDRVFKDYQRGRHAERMLGIHHVAAAEMRDSAHRCGIEASFVATVDGVLATHENSLPPIDPGACVRLEFGDGYAILKVAGVAADGAGTLYRFETPRLPEDTAEIPRGVDLVRLRFEGDPGKPPPPPIPPPPMSASYAARNHRVVEYIAALKKSVCPG